MLEKFILAIGDAWPLYLEPVWQPLWSGLVTSQALSGSITVLIGAYFAIPYFKQKDYEAIQKRYVDRIEALIDYFHHISKTLENNYTHALQTFKLFREVNFEQFTNWYQNQSRTPQKLGAEMPSEFRVPINFFGNAKIAELCIDVFINSARLNEKFITEIPIYINGLIANQSSKILTLDERIKIAESSSDELQSEWNKIRKETRLYELPDQLERILIAARGMKLDTYKKLPRLKKDPEVMRAVEVMDRWFDESKSK